MKAQDPPSRDQDLAAALEGALARHERGLVLCALRRVGDLERARDVVQETFLRLIREPALLLGPSEPLAQWLYTVAKNKALDVLRKEQRMTPLSDEKAAAAVSPAQGPGAGLETADSAARALALVERLPGKQAEVVRLKFTQGLSYQEISQRIDVSAGQVGWLLHQAMKTLRAELVGHEDGQGARA